MTGRQDQAKDADAEYCGSDANQRNWSSEDKENGSPWKRSVTIPPVLVQIAVDKPTTARPHDASEDNDYEARHMTLFCRCATDWNCLLRETAQQNVTSSIIYYAILFNNIRDS